MFIFLPCRFGLNHSYQSSLYRLNPNLPPTITLLYHAIVFPLPSRHSEWKLRLALSVVLLSPLACHLSLRKFQHFDSSITLLLSVSLVLLSHNIPRYIFIPPSFPADHFTKSCQSRKSPRSFFERVHQVLAAYRNPNKPFPSILEYKQSIGYVLYGRLQVDKATKHRVLVNKEMWDMDRGTCRRGGKTTGIAHLKVQRWNFFFQHGLETWCVLGGRSNCELPRKICQK